MEDHEKYIIKDFIKQYYKINNTSDLDIIWEYKINSNRKDVDAYFDKYKLLIEHTSIDVVDDKQRGDDFKFKEVFGGLEKEITNTLFNKSYRITVIIKSNSIKSDKNWRILLRKKFKQYIINESHKLPFGSNEVHIDGLSFSFIIRKRKTDNFKISIGRDIPEEDTLSNRLRNRIFNKLIKFEQFKLKDYHKVLLIENADIQLMSEDKFYDAINEIDIADKNHLIDKIWYTDSSIKDDIQHWLVYNSDSEAIIEKAELLR